LLVKKLSPEAKINLDFDFFVRGLVSGFYWVASHPLQALDTAWGEFYRTIVLRILMALARLSAWFDRWGIDGVVDNMAYGTRGLGEKIRGIQSGNIQYYLALALVAIFAILGVYLLT
jgi:multicomponent Na+:H+ antiporter subunit D